MDPRVESVPLFNGFSTAEMEGLKKCLREKSFEKGESLFLEGNDCQQIFLIREGRAKLYRTSSSGREQILETLGPGDTCACNPGCAAWSCVSSAEALTPCKVWYLQRKDYVHLVQSNSKLAHTLNLLFAEKLRRFSCLIEEVSLKDVRKRVVKFLLDMLDENESKGEAQKTLFVPFTRQEIAQRIGTSRETVARYLHELKRSKLIDIKSHQIFILQKEKLSQLLN
jgi:CRP/FNR family transcriptional regulator